MKASFQVAFVITVVLTIWGNALSQAPTASAPPPQQPAPNPTAPAKTPAQLVGIYVYPTKEQDQAQQAKDETECYDASKQQSGWDPAAPAQPVQAPAGPQRGGAVKGAAGGAAGGAAIGAIAGDAGEGAAIGATAGAIRGKRQQKKANKQAEQQTKQAAQTQQSQQLDGFRRSMGACLEARGYTAK
jgi:outer membrane lipoprotein SlyB